MIPHGNTLNYVASGMQFLRFPYVESIANQEAMETMGKWIARLNGANSHYFSVLFNAFTEKKVGDPSERFIRPYVYDMHADSGGLQIVSRGFTADEKRKQEVYKIQGRYSDVAMSFDEIPAYTIVAKSVLKDATNKVFDRSRLEACARETGKNLRKQIESFIQQKTDTKPLAIIQGNDLETATIWVEEMFKEIPEELYSHIKGVAIGSPCIGVGEVEEIEKLFWFTQIPLPLKDIHLHMLGVGSINRIAPLAAFVRGGLIKDTFISYDSTTHTAMNIRGRYYYGLKDGLAYQTKVSKVFIPEYESIYNDIIEFAPELTQWADTPKKFFDFLITDAKLQKEQTGTQIPLIMCVKAHGFACMNNFTKHVEKSLVDDKVFHDIIGSEHRQQIYDNLSSIKTKSDYYYWKANNARFLDSKPTRTNHVTLEDFFV